MANFRIELYVNALRRQAFFDMMIPNDWRAGAHDMNFWSAYVEKIIPWMFG
mgnify:CR=1 FL=1